MPGPDVETGWDSVPGKRPDREGRARGTHHAFDSHQQLGGSRQEVRTVPEWQPTAVTSVHSVTAG